MKSKKYGSFILVFLFLISVVNSSATSNQTQPLKPTPWESPFGLNVHGNWFPIKLSSLKPGMQRECIHWLEVEEKKGKYVIPINTVESVKWMIRNRIEPLLILSGNNPIYSGSDPNLITIPSQKDNGNYEINWGVHTEENRKAYAEFAKFVVKETRGKVKYFEIWNEPEQNGWVPLEAGGKESALEYAQLLKAVYSEIKKVNPEVVVIADIGCNRNFVDIVMKNVPDAMDVLSIHPYVFSQKSPESGGLVEELKATREIVDRYRPGLPIWVTEFGYVSEKPLGDKIRKVTLHEQAQYLVRGSLLGIGETNVERFLLYIWQDESSAPMTEGRAFGLLRRNTAGTEKPAYYAVQTLNQMTLGYKLIRKASVGSNGFNYTFENDEDRLEVIWKDGEPEEISLPVNGTYVIVTDLFGNESLHEAKDGTLKICNSQDVLYIRNALPHEIRLWKSR